MASRLEPVERSIGEPIGYVLALNDNFVIDRDESVQASNGELWIALSYIHTKLAHDLHSDV